MSTPPPPSLVHVLRGIAAHRYAVMKSLPDAEPAPGSDIDLLCEDAVSLGRQLVRNCRPLIDTGYAVRIRQIAETKQTHIDLMSGDRIQLRLDLHEGLGAYPGLAVRQAYAVQLLDRRAWATLGTPHGPLRLAVPDAADNLVLRYLEYHAFFDGRPDKIKHADAIAQQIHADPALQGVFFDRLAQATTTRPIAPVLRHSGLNLRRQMTWFAWGLRDKAAWRVAWVKQVLTLALTEPGLFARKLAHKLAPRRGGGLTPEAQ